MGPFFDESTPGKRMTLAHLARDALALEAAPKQMCEERRRVEQAHLLVAQRRAEQHAAQDLLALSSDDHCRRKRKAQADAVVLEMAVIDEHVGGVEQQAHQHQELVPQTSGAAADVSRAQPTRRDKGGGEERSQVRQHDSPAQEHLGTGRFVPARGAQSDSRRLEDCDKLAV